MKIKYLLFFLLLSLLIMKPSKALAKDNFDLHKNIKDITKMEHKKIIRCKNKTYIVSGRKSARVKKIEAVYSMINDKYFPIYPPCMKQTECNGKITYIVNVPKYKKLYKKNKRLVNKYMKIIINQCKITKRDSAATIYEKYNTYCINNTVYDYKKSDMISNNLLYKDEPGICIVKYKKEYAMIIPFYFN